MDENIRGRLYLLGQQPDWRLIVSASVQKCSHETELVDLISLLYSVDQDRIQSRYFGPKISIYHFKLGLFVPRI